MDTIDRLLSILEVLNRALAGTYGDGDDDCAVQEMFANTTDAQIAMFRDAMEEIAYELDALITELVECELGDDNNG